MSRKQLPERWETARLLIRDAVHEDLPALTSIYRRTAYIGAWTGVSRDAADDVEKEFRHANVPPGQDPAQHRFQAVVVRETGETAGACAFFHGFPDPKSLWIVVLALDPKWQQQRFATEWAAQLKLEARRLGTFESIQTSISVNNWPVLRFCIRAGINVIEKFSGEGTHDPKQFPTFRLRMPLA